MLASLVQVFNFIQEECSWDGLWTRIRSAGFGVPGTHELESWDTPSRTNYRYGVSFLNSKLSIYINCGNAVLKTVSSYHIELWWDPTVCYITLIYHVYVPRRTQLWVANRWLWDSGVPGVRLNIKTSSQQHRNFHYENKLIFIMEIPIPGKTVFILRRDPGSRLLCGSSSMSPLFGTPCCHCTETCMFSCLLHTK